MRLRILVSSILLVASSSIAQNESDLRRFFEGTTVTVKMDMPATQLGVEVHPTASMPVDFRKVAEELKAYGIGIHQGESIMVTKVHVKEHHIEFQLGGGGFGTFSDMMQQASSSPTYYYEGKSRREKDIENELKYTWDDRRRRELKEELDDLRRDRYRDNAWSSTMNAQAAQQQRANEHEQRAQSGSRFNIRYEDGYPNGALTPDGIMDALRNFVEFPGDTSSRPVVEETSASEHAVSALRKGLTISQVEKILGPAVSATTSDEGSLEIMKRDYSTEGQRVTTKFVGGVLVDYSITPEG